MTDKNSKNSEQSQAIEFGTLPTADKEFVVDALNKGATRRQVTGWLMAMGATAVSAGSVVTAASEAIAATPKKGGKVKAGMNIHGPDDTLDPIGLTSNADYSRARCHYNSLIQLRDDIVPQPELAETFEANADASEWTFKLRKDVKFHDGSKLTADDVIWSMTRHLGKESKSVAKGLVKSVKEWKKVGPYEVKAICDSPYADLAAVLGEKHFKIAKADTKDFATSPGTGPYKLKSFKPGVGSIHVRNEDYWREGGNFDEIEIFGITDPVARVNALLAGDVHMANAVNPKSISQVDAAAGVSIRSLPSGSYFGIAVHTKNGPGTNADFVNALKYLVRRDRIVKNVLKGNGTVGNDHPINVAYGVDFCKDLPIRAYDPDKAKSLLKKSGITSAEISVGEVAAGVTEVALILQRECKKVGFDLRIKKVPTDGYWGAVWQKAPICTTAWNMRPTASIMLDIAYAPGAPWSDTFWSDDRMGVLLSKAKAEVDPKNKYELLCQMQKVVSENAPVIIPGHRNLIEGYSDKLKGMPKLPLGDLGGSEWPERAWMDT